eukprot:scaffold1828_cov169-Amphora_coffeaeformis.AAC.4
MIAQGVEQVQNHLLFFIVQCDRRYLLEIQQGSQFSYKVLLDVPRGFLQTLARRVQGPRVPSVSSSGAVQISRPKCNVGFRAVAPSARIGIDRLLAIAFLILLLLLLIIV